MDISFSRYERLNLYNQYKILEKLYPEESGYYQQCQEIVASGYAGEYPDLIDGFSEFTAEQCKEVNDILHMYDMLNLTYSQLDDKSGIDADSLSFPGFDGNGEDGCDGHMRYVRFLHRRGRWDSVLGVSEVKDFNSHWPMLPTYRVMLKRFNASPDKVHLTRADIMRIVTGLERA